MPTMKQPAMTKHPEGTGSYYLRVAFPGGSTWQACTEEPAPISKMLESLQEHMTMLQAAIALEIAR